MKNIDSDYICEAYFVIKENLSENPDEYKIANEAERLIREYGTGAKSKQRRKLSSALILALLAGAVTALAVSLIFICINFSA